MNYVEFTLAFYECEHSGDLEVYLADLRKAGAKILSTSINEAEIGRVRIQVADRATFIEAFKKTDSYGFSTLA
jgi:hypothetical protein